MSKGGFFIYVYNGKEMLDNQFRNGIGAAIEFAKSCLYELTHFEIHKNNENSPDYLKGFKKGNDHIDWIRKAY